jgi:sporulation protein YlmC with PRC-barrel domain
LDTYRNNDWSSSMRRFEHYRTTAGILSAAAFSVVVALSAPAASAANAQRNTANQQGATATNPAGSDMIKPDQMRASKVIGSTVYDVQNQNIGDVKDIVLDKDGQVSAVVVGVGGFLGMGEKNVAVKLSDIKTDNNRLTLDKSKEQLQQAANYQLEDRTTGAGTTSSPVHGGQAGTGGPASGSSAPPPPQR